MKHVTLISLLALLAACGGSMQDASILNPNNTVGAQSNNPNGSTGTSSPTVGSPALVCQGTPVWADEFSGTALDTNKWNVEVNCTGGGNNEQECYENNSNNIAIDGNGHLVITVIKQSGYALPYTSGRINSANKGDWDFGCFEASLQVPKGQGLWPAFWMLNTNSPFGAWPTSGELDIMEILGQDTTKLYGTAHFGPAYPNQQQAGGTTTAPDFSSAFHTYSITKNPNEVTWYVDGNAYFTLHATDKEDWGMTGWPFVTGNPFHFIFNVAMGGNFPKTPDPNILRASMNVDYVRAYAQ